MEITKINSPLDMVIHYDVAITPDEMDCYRNMDQLIASRIIEKISDDIIKSDIENIMMRLSYDKIAQDISTRILKKINISNE